MKLELILGGLAAVLLVSLRVRSQTYGVTNDVWDVSQGTVVTTNSPSARYFSGDPFHAENIFGANVPGFQLEPGDFIFADRQPAGTTNFVEWQTVLPVTVSSFRLYASGDGRRYGYQREFNQFTLLAKSPGSDQFDLILYTTVASHPYFFVDASRLLALEANITPVTASDFRAEFTSPDFQPYNGPRIVELDGFSDPIPPRTNIYPAVEISWSADAGQSYQVQYRTTLVQTNWTNLGDPVSGAGQAVSLFDTTRNDASRFYRTVNAPADTIDPAVEITWDSIAGHDYKIQYQTVLDNITWTDLTGPINGTGGLMSSFDLAHSGPSPLYRVIDLTPGGGGHKN